MPEPSGERYYREIVLPGSVLGVIVGYATSGMGRLGLRYRRGEAWAVAWLVFGRCDSGAHEIISGVGA